ncbi:hypothetical protein BRO54_1080 [Geobacillus proteiniphilus]|uniref:Uncharacterized protein n=1 Tax=Geobacillus proteiniphilus TaxID=860353 RepID=A0A1Q5T503_9BACL|nr:hypothetical protein BRO54_1080 [Geobacillus proteiniphilus]
MRQPGMTRAVHRECGVMLPLAARRPVPWQMVKVKANR